MLKRFILTPLAATVLSACAVGPDYHAPQTKPAEKFDAIEATYSTQDGVAKFWDSFADTTLERLVDEATKSNYDVRIALSRVAEARALRRDSAFDLAPSINAGGGYTKTKFAQGTRLLRPRASRRRGQQRGARRRRGGRTRRAGHRDC
jgi:multidrug efflux system outer membrane protein